MEKGNACVIDYLHVSRYMIHSPCRNSTQLFLKLFCNPKHIPSIKYFSVRNLQGSPLSLDLRLQNFYWKFEISLVDLVCPKFDITWSWNFNDFIQVFFSFYFFGRSFCFSKCMNQFLSIIRGISYLICLFTVTRCDHLLSPFFSRFLDKRFLFWLR